MTFFQNKAIYLYYIIILYLWFSGYKPNRNPFGSGQTCFELTFSLSLRLFPEPPHLSALRETMSPLFCTTTFAFYLTSRNLLMWWNEQYLLFWVIASSWVLAPPTPSRPQAQSPWLGYMGTGRSHLYALWWGSDTGLQSQMFPVNNEMSCQREKSFCMFCFLIKLQISGAFIPVENSPSLLSTCECFCIGWIPPLMNIRLAN